MVYPAEPELTLRDLVHIVRRRLPLILLFGAVGFLLSLVIALAATRRYQATATIQVEKESTTGLDLGSIGGSTRSVTDALNSDIELQTQASILQSNALALRVIRRLNLQNTPDYKTKSDVGSSTNTSPAALASSPVYQAHLLNTFHGYLSVKPVGGTHLIDISYLNPDPRLAADVVNGTVQELIDESRETRIKSAQSASEELSRQLADLRVHSEELQAQVARMQQDSGIYSIGTTDARGNQQAYSAVLEQFQRAAKTVSDADENLILKKGIADAARSGNPEVLSSLAGNAAISGNVTQALSTLQTLRTQQATVQAQLDQLKVKFGPGYPRVAELQANLSGLDAAIKQETTRIGQRAQSDYEVASRTEQEARRTYNEQKAKADALNNKAVNYIITRQEADESRTLYEDLLRRLKEAGILEDLKSGTVTVIDPALVPPTPSKPRRKLYVAAGLLGGLFTGIVVVLLTNLLSDKLEDADDLHGLGLPVPATVSQSKGSSTAWGRRGEAGYEDALRRLRYAIARTDTETGAGSVSEAAGKVVLFGTVSPRESMATLPADVAESFTRQNKKVLLIKTDVRSQSAASSASGEGLYAVLAGRATEATAIQAAGPNLYLLPAGQAGSNPSDLLDSDRMRSLLLSFRNNFDLVILSGPPVTSFSETQILAEMANLSVLRAHVGLTTKTALKRAYDSLRRYSTGPVFVFLDENGSAGALHRYYGFRSQEARVG